MDIQQEIQEIREKKFLKDMDSVYNKLESIVKEEMGTILPVFLKDYYELKKKYNPDFDPYG